MSATSDQMSAGPQRYRRRSGTPLGAKRAQNKRISENQIFRTGIVLACLSTAAFGEEKPTAGLPDSPGSMLSQAATTPTSDAQTPTPQFTGRLDGTVFDINGDPVPGASITLTEEERRGKPLDIANARTAASDAEGHFLLAALPSGKFTVTVSSPGLKTFIYTGIIVHDKETTELFRIVLPLASTSADVQVTVTEEEIAEEQVKLQEKQRVFGIFPNFYSSYIWNAAPLTSKQKFGLAIHSVTDPVIFVVTGAAAGVEQARNTFPAYGQGTAGYAKRYFSDYTDEFDARMFSSAVYPSLFHQDPRYFYKGEGSIKSRAIYAITRAFITRGDNGQSEFNYSRVLGSFTAGGLSNAYHQGRDRSVGLTMRNSFIALGGHAADNLLREFLFRRFTPDVPDYDEHDVKK